MTQGQARVMNGDDLRFVLPPREQLEAADFAALRAALGDVLATAPIEIGLVGDFDEAEAIAMVARTFGALPMRKAEAGIDLAARATRYSGAFGIHILPHRGEANQMAWRRVWPTTDDSDQRLELTMELLADIVRIRLLDELREKLGATYGAGASSDMSDIYTGRGTFSVGTNGDPKDIDAIEKAVEAVIAEITAAPVDADLFERGRKPSLESYADWRRQNSTWMQIVDQAQTEPGRLERFRRNEERFRSITAQDVWEAAKRFLADKPSYIFRAMPEAKAAAPAG
jgi:zinc protease